MNLLSLFNTLIRFFPKRFVTFILVGVTGTLLHVATLAAFFQLLHYSFIISQIIATYTAMTCNYLINNHITFRDNRHKGKHMISGLLSFYLVCTIGAFVNVQFAQFLYAQQVNWAMAGVLGGAAGSVFNYAFSSAHTWKTKKL